MVGSSATPKAIQIRPWDPQQRHVNSLWVVTLAGPELYTCATRARAGAEWSPGAPVAVAFEDVRGQPDAVTFKAMLSERKVG